MPAQVGEPLGAAPPVLGEQDHALVLQGDASAHAGGHDQPDRSAELVVDAERSYRVCAGLNAYLQGTTRTRTLPRLRSSEEPSVLVTGRR